MKDELGLPKKGDVFYQRAEIMEIIPSPNPEGRASYKLHVSNEQGVIDNAPTKENSVSIFNDNFQEQFQQEDGREEGVFLRACVVESAEGEEISFYRLTKKGEVIRVLCHEKTQRFLKTHFLLTQEIDTLAQIEQEKRGGNESGD